MSRMVLAAVAVLATLSGAPAVANEQCTSGPAADASAARPHGTDPADDAYPYPAGQEGPHHDLRTLWVGRDASGFTANVQVADLDAAREMWLVFEYGDDRFFDVWIDGAGRARFGYGTVERGPEPLDSTRYTKTGSTTGTVDTANDIVRIALTDSILDGVGPTLVLDSVRTYYSPTAPVLGDFLLGASVLADDFTNGSMCAAQLR